MNLFSISRRVVPFDTLTSKSIVSSSTGRLSSAEKTLKELNDDISRPVVRTSRARASDRHYSEIYHEGQRKQVGKAGDQS